MLVLIVLSALVIGLFVAGVAFLSQGFLGSPDMSRLVSKSEMQQAQAALQTARAEEDRLKVEVAQLTGNLQKAQGDQEDLAMQEKMLAEASAGLADARQKIQKLEDNLKFISSRADEQARESVAMIERLDRERGELRQQLAAAAEQGQALEELEVLKAERNGLQTQLDVNVGRIRDLEVELKEMYDRSEGERGQARDAVRQLADQNQKLETDLKTIIGKIGEVRQLAGRQLTASQEELAASRDQVQGLESQLGALRRELSDNAAQLEEARRPVPPVAVPAGVSDPLPAAPLPERDDVQLRQLQQINAHLLKKQELLQRELTKHRARALGLEKICHEFKRQFSPDEG